jgi:CheY-like chemotaxis protein
MKNLLVVDDEKNFLLSLTDMFRQHGDQYALFTAYNGLEAIEVLERENIALVITDLKMPVMDGFGLLAHMTVSQPDIPVIVMTAFATPENADRLDTLGLYRYIENPVEFNALLSTIQKVLEHEAQGHISGVSLASFLQLVGLDNKTCTLRITSGARVGVFYFKDGELMDALSEELSGEEAAIEIAGWHPVEIDIEESCRKDEKRIDPPLGFILIEGARRKDEREEEAAQEKENKNELVAPAETEVRQETDAAPNDLTESEDNRPRQASPLLNLQDKNRQPEAISKRPHISETIKKIRSALQDALGPVSDMIMRDTLDSWEKSGNADADRLSELVDALCMEIGNDRLEITFRSAIKPALIEAGITPPNSIFSPQVSLNQTDNPPAEQDISDLYPKIKKAFTGTIGPVGDMLMKETVAKWSRQGPQTISRLDELVDLLCTEIDDQDLEHFFRSKIAKLL